MRESNLIREKNEEEEEEEGNNRVYTIEWKFLNQGRVSIDDREIRSA